MSGLTPLFPPRPLPRSRPRPPRPRLRFAKSCYATATCLCRPFASSVQPFRRSWQSTQPSTLVSPPARRGRKRERNKKIVRNRGQWAVRSSRAGNFFGMRQNIARRGSDTVNAYKQRCQSLLVLTRQGRLVLVEVYGQDGRATRIAVLACERLDVVNVDSLGKEKREGGEGNGRRYT